MKTLEENGIFLELWSLSKDVMKSRCTKEKTLMELLHKIGKLLYRKTLKIHRVNILKNKR